MKNDETFKLVNNYMAPLDFVYLKKEETTLPPCKKLYRLERVEYPRYKGIHLYFTDGYC